MSCAKYTSDVLCSALHWCELLRRDPANLYDCAKQEEIGRWRREIESLLMNGDAEDDHPSPV